MTRYSTETFRTFAIFTATSAGGIAHFLCVIALAVFTSCNYAGNGSGDANNNNQLPDLTPPAEVTNLKVTYTASRTVKLDWKNPADLDFAKVEIFNGEDKISEVLKSASPNNEVTVRELTNGTEYVFTVKTYDLTGNVSAGTSITVKPRQIFPEDLAAGTKPENEKGSEDLPKFTSDNGTTFQWYKGKAGNWEKLGESSKAYSKKIEVESGVTYYMCEAKSKNGTSIAYSKVFTVECGTEKTNKIGYIAYKNGDKTEAHADYDSYYGTPIGIVFDVNSKGEPTKILNLNQQGSLVWCLKEVQGAYKNFAKDVEKLLSYIDGSINWNIICENVTDWNVPGNYSAFEYCNGLPEGGKKWYLPAKDELVAVSYNLSAINSAISKLPEGTATKLPNGKYDWLLSSSQYADTDVSPWVVYLYDGKQYEGTKHSVSNVRAVAAFQ